MLSYRHVYHAGNIGDVLKHAVLSLLIEALERKDTPFCYLDTHAGAARYDLGSEPAQKHREYKQGVERLWWVRDLPPGIRAYMWALRAVNGAASPGAVLRFYPGSPWIVHSLLRAQDRMILTELNRNDLEALKTEFAGDRRVAVHHLDGYQALRAFLPPRERRGVVLIDPSFENPSEFHRLLEQLEEVLGRWPTGVYALWYPLASRYPLAPFYCAIRDSGIRKVLLAELSIYPDDNPLGLNGSGMLIVNPPWQLDAQLAALLPALWKILSIQGLGRHRLEWLVPE